MSLLSLAHARLNRNNLDLNVALLSWWRSGTNLLSAYLNENGWLYVDEPYSQLTKVFTKNYKDMHTQEVVKLFTHEVDVFDTWLLSLLSTSPVPSCIKVHLPNLFARTGYAEIALASRRLLGTCYPQSVILYRKAAFDLTASKLLADAKQRYVVETSADIKTNMEYNRPVSLSIDAFEKEIEIMYKFWMEFLATPQYSSNVEMYVTHEDDIINLPVKTYKQMPSKTKIISNYADLQDHYNNKYLGLFDKISEEIDYRRSKSLPEWSAFLKRVESHSQKIKTLEERP